MMKTKLQITIDIEQRPDAEELSTLGFKSELEYWIDLIYSDPSMMLDGAQFIIEHNEQITQSFEQKYGKV